MWAWPGAESDYVAKTNGRCERVILAKCEVVSRTSTQFIAPGMVDENLNVVCGKDAIENPYDKTGGIKPDGFQIVLQRPSDRAGRPFYEDPKPRTYVENIIMGTMPTPR